VAQQQSSQPAVPAGWYPDPAGAPDQRYWNGYEWTGYVRAAPPPERQLTTLPPRAAVVGLLGLAVGAVAALVLSLVVYLPTGSTPLAVLGSEAGLWAAFFGTTVLVSHRCGRGTLRDDYGFEFRPSDVGAGLLSFGACLLAAGAVGSLFVRTKLQGTNTGIISGARHDVVGLAIVAGIATIGAPVFEELFFRGLMRRSLETRFGPAKAVWLQAVVFSLGHYQVGMGLGNVSVIAGTCALGVVLGYTALMTKRLAPGMIAHGLFNGLVTLSIIVAHH
jgi:membrane protease YdiL (CAAX protease family)